MGFLFNQLLHVMLVYIYIYIILYTYSLLRLDRATFYVYSVPSGPEFKRVDLVNKQLKMAIAVTLADLFR